jgi:beta-phosphoglucomutase-like phosphatase (HAD superfamily)
LKKEICLFMNIRVTFHDGPPPNAAAIAAAAKTKLDLAAKLAASDPSNLARQSAHAKADEAYKIAAENAALKPIPGLREAVKAVADKHQRTYTDIGPNTALISAGTAASADAVMKDEELNAIAPIQIEVIQ